MEFLFSKERKVSFVPNVCVSSTFGRKEPVNVVLRLRHSHCRALESSGLPRCFKAGSNFVGFLIKQHWRLWFLVPSLEFISEARVHLWRELSNSELNRKKKTSRFLWHCTVQQAHLRDVGEIILVVGGERLNDIKWAKELPRIYVA